VRSLHPVGNAPATAIGPEYGGAWVENRTGGSHDTLLIKSDPANPNTLIVRGKHTADSFDLVLTESGANRYFNIDFEDQTYVWGRLVRRQDTLELWHPRLECFQAAVDAKELAGHIASKAGDSGTSSGSESEVVLTDSSSRIVRWIERDQRADSVYEGCTRWIRIPPPVKKQAPRRRPS
jgi:hypothetical protein